MGKYEGLTNYLLSNCNQTYISLSFQEINKIISPNFLPASAYIYREWWANDDYHSQAQSWYDAHFLVYKVKDNTVIFYNCNSDRPPTKEFNSNKNRRKQGFNSSMGSTFYIILNRKKIIFIYLSYNIFSFFYL